MLPPLTNRLATIITSSNGQEALDKFIECNGEVKLVLMDCEMPILDGYLATKMIREHERDKGLTRCHLVGVSGNSGE